MTTKKPTQTELYGELLGSEQRYRKEVRQYSRLTQEQEESLVNCARGGNIEARNTLICSLLPVAAAYATRYARIARSISFLDFCQIASTEMLVMFDKAIEKEDPCSYLLAVARTSIQKQCSLRDSLIVRTCSEDWNKDDIECLSLDIPLDENGLQFSDIIEDSSFQFLCDPSNEKHTFLYTAIQSLSGREQMVILRCHGLSDEPVVTPQELECEMTGKVMGQEKCNTFYNYRYRAYAKLRKSLGPLYATA